MEETFSVVKSLLCRFSTSHPGVRPGVLGSRRHAPGATASRHPNLPGASIPKAQQMLDRAIQALGGQAFLNAKTLTTKGRVFSIQDEATAGLAPYQSYVSVPGQAPLLVRKDPSLSS